MEAGNGVHDGLSFGTAVEVMVALATPIGKRNCVRGCMMYPWLLSGNGVEDVSA